METVQPNGGIIRTDPSDIEGLSEEELPRLLKILLDNVALSINIPLGCWSVNAHTKAADEGVDASIYWQAPSSTALPAWFPGTDVVFQCKACGEFGPTECGKEMLARKSGDVKPALADLFSRSGKYILMATPAWTDGQKKKRTDEMVKQVTMRRADLIDKVNIELYDAGTISSWVNRFPTAIVQVLAWRGKQPPTGLENADVLLRDPRYSNPFHPSREQQDIVDTLKQQLLTHRVWHVVGAPGIGKTRLVVEALRPVDAQEVSPSVLMHSALYIDTGSAGSDGIRHAWNWTKSTNVPCVFVVDNCSPGDYAWLAQEAASGATGLTFVGLSRDVCDLLPSKTAFVLDPLPDDVMKLILGDCKPLLSQWDTEFAIRQAQGYPGIGLHIAKQLRTGDYSVAALLEQSSVGTMFERARTLPPDEFPLVTALALFTRVGFRGKFTEELGSLGKHLCNGTDHDLLRTGVDKLIAAGYVKSIGDYIAVEPRLLALRIASHWWFETSPEAAASLIQAFPPSLAVSFCERLSQLHFSDMGKKTVELLCRPNGYLSSPDFLVTQTGANLLSAVAECNPVATTGALRRVFTSSTPDEALKAMKSGEALVEAMVKLCWWSECFAEAVPILLVFAAAEATLHHQYIANQYLDLFRLSLPGTQTPLLQRLPALDDALDSPFEACRVLGVRGLCSGLTTGSCVRMGGVESQGERQPLPDYHPQFMGEITEYWHQITTKLEEALNSEESVIRHTAAAGFLEKLYGLLTSGLLDVARPLVSAIIENHREYLPALRNKVSEFMDRRPESETTELQDWLAAMAPRTLVERMQMEVLDARQFHRPGKSSDEAQARLKQLAAYCSDHVAEMVAVVPILIEHATATEGLRFSFGEKLGESLKDPWSVVDEFLSAIRATATSMGNTNVMILTGLLASLRKQDGDQVERTLDLVRADSVLAPFLVDLTARSRPILSSVQRCVDAAVHGEIDISSLSSLTDSFVLRGVQPRDVARIADSLHSVGTPAALRLSLEFLRSPTSVGEAALLAETRSALRSLLMDHRLASCLEGGQSLDWYWWDEGAAWLLTGQQDEELALDIARQILFGFDLSELDLYDSVNSTIHVLLREYWALVWLLIRETVTAGGVDSAERARSTFDGPRPGRCDLEIGISQITQEDARVWCAADDLRAPPLLLYLLPIGVRNTDSTKYSWGTVARYVVDKYGHDSNVLDALGRRLHSFSGYGSREGSPRTVADLYAQLEASPNRQVRGWAHTVRVKLEEFADEFDARARENEDAARLL